MKKQGEALMREISSPRPSREAVLRALALRGRGQAALFEAARRARDAAFPGRPAEVRSVIEISNRCARGCRFCNIGSLPASGLYALSSSEVFAIAESLYRERGRRVFLLQSGEDLSKAALSRAAGAVRLIKGRLPGSEVILCLGTLPRSSYAELKRAGADRYILKFETSDPELYSFLKPGDSLARRTAALRDLAELGFDIGTGNIVGLPGQDAASLARDLSFFRRFSPGMVSASVFIPGEGSPLAGAEPGGVDSALNFMALLRLRFPRAVIPSTSSLEKARRGAQLLGLMAGANSVTIHDGTPGELKPGFPIYSLRRFTPAESFLRRIIRGAGLKPAGALL